MTDCQRCGGRANDSYLCKPCSTTLQTQLADMPWWLERLLEAALGQTRMSDNAGRKSARRKDLDGDATIASCIEPLPDNKDHDLDKARRDREKVALAHALATGGINARASELLGTVANSLQYWVKELCDVRGIDYVRSPLARPTAPGSEYATWLRVNVAAIAQSEFADDIAGDIDGHLEAIVNVVNRPIRWWALGPCPGWIDDRRTHTSQECLVELRAPAGTEEIQCQRCKTRHNVHRLLLARKADAEAAPMTHKQLVRYNGELPPEFQVPPRTLRHWLATGKLCACGTNGTDPLYSWIDVRLLMLDSKHSSVARRVGSAPTTP